MKKFQVEGKTFVADNGKLHTDKGVYITDCTEKAAFLQACRYLYEIAQSVDLTDKEKLLLKSVLDDASQYSTPSFWANGSCKSKSNVGVLSSLIKKGVVAKDEQESDYYSITDNGLSMADALGYIEPLRGVADWLYGK